MLIRGAKTRTNKNAGLADVYNVMTKHLENIPGLQCALGDMVGLSATDAGSPLRLSQVLSLVAYTNIDPKPNPS